MDSQNTKNRPKYEMIEEALLERIHAGDFSFDEAFCTEKMLSEQYEVSRITAKRAIEDLEQQGILYRKRGVGSFVSRNLPSDDDAADAPKMISLLVPFATTQGNISEAIGTLSAVLAEQGYFLSIHVTGSSSPKERATLKLLRSQNIAGLVYYPKRDNIHLEELNDFMFAGRPIVIIDKQTDCPYLNNVVCDNYDGGRQTARHLLEQGHRNIAFYTAAPLSETSSVRDRFAGFLHEMKAAGIAPNPQQLVTCCQELSDDAALSTERTPFQEQLLAMHRDGITAIIAENDRIAELIFLACRTIGLRIPEDFCLCGFDDTNVSRSLGITSIHQDFAGIGREVGRVLLAALENPAAETEKIILPVTLVPRSSSLR
ncbi:substrate-binding domain-containing protein [Fusicatenibacter saccharivorans]|uniref:substrate-binding domain-containing protein n=1 Tax=Fusicatenibacter saccharivorans TaxID=1150298 RepID=UPI0032C0564B